MPKLENSFVPRPFPRGHVLGVCDLIYGLFGAINLLQGCLVNGCVSEGFYQAPILSLSEECVLGLPRFDCTTRRSRRSARLQGLSSEGCWK